MLATRRLALFAPLLFLVVPAACGSEPEAPLSPGDGGPSGPSGSSEEAGSTPEAGVDALVPPQVAVAVTVLDGAKPFPDVRVLFHDATGAVIGEQKTDATGKVTTAQAPSMVTVLARSANAPGAAASAITYLGVATGDRLLVVVPSSTAAPVVGKYSVTLQPVDGVADYGVTVMGTCGAANFTPAAPVLVDLFDACLASQTAVLARATNPGGLAGFGFTKTAARPAAGATVDVALALAAPSASARVTAVNLPTGAPAFRAGLLAIANGAAFPIGEGAGSLGDVGGVAFPIPTGFADAYQATLSRSVASAAGANDQLLRRRDVATATPTLVVDGASALPALTITDGAIGHTQPERPDVAVTSAGSLTAADGGLVKLTWSGATWAFVVPPAITTFKAPALPADAADFVPRAGARLGSVIYFESSLVPGYTDVKALPMATSAFPFDPLAAALPATGTLTVSRFVEGG